MWEGRGCEGGGSCGKGVGVREEGDVGRGGVREEGGGKERGCEGGGRCGKGVGV